MNSKKVIAFFVLILAMLTGCQKQQNNLQNINDNSEKNVLQDSQVSAVVTENSSKIEADLSSGVTVDAQLSIPEGVNFESVPVYTASLQEIPLEKANDVLIKNKKIIQKTEGPTEENSGNGMYKYFEAEDGSTLSYNGGVLLYYSSLQYSNIQINHEIEDGKKERFNQDFDFGTRESAEKEIHKVLSDLGIQVYGEYACYSLDYEYLQETAQSGAKIEGDDLNCYLFEYLEIANDMPITNQMREAKAITIPAPVIYVVYSKNGIEQIEISNCFQIESEEDQMPICDADGALSLLDHKYNSIILEGNYSVEKMQLEYVPTETQETGRYNLVPAWRFYITHELSTRSKQEEDTSETVKIPTEILFNAIDGKEILTGVGV